MMIPNNDLQTFQVNRSIQHLDNNDYKRIEPVCIISKAVLPYFVVLVLASMPLLLSAWRVLDFVDNSETVEDWKIAMPGQAVCFDIA